MFMIVGSGSIDVNKQRQISESACIVCTYHEIDRQFRSIKVTKMSWFRRIYVYYRVPVAVGKRNHVLPGTSTN